MRVKIFSAFVTAFTFFACDRAIGPDSSSQEGNGDFEIIEEGIVVPFRPSEIIEGDIVIPLRSREFNDDGTPLAKNSGNIRPDANSRWPNGIVPYTRFSLGSIPQITQRLPTWVDLTNAIYYWNSISHRTGITFVERDPAIHANYVHFAWSTTTCNSWVGMVGGGAQTVNVGPRCGSGSGRIVGIIHEMGHVVGLYHEHQRQDRNQNISVTGNVAADPVNFGLIGTNHGNYDGTSIMHYMASGNSCYDTDANNTCDHRDIYVASGPVIINPGTRLSEGDIAAVRFLYP